MVCTTVMGLRKNYKKRHTGISFSVWSVPTFGKHSKTEPAPQTEINFWLTGLKIAARQPPALWPHLLETFHWRNMKSLLCCSRHFISDNKAAKKRFWNFWKHFKMSRKSRKRFGKIKGAARVEKENSCSPWLTNFFTRLFKHETTKLEFKDNQNSRQNLKLNWSMKTLWHERKGVARSGLWAPAFFSGAGGGSHSLYLISLYPNNQVHKQQTWHPRSQRSLMGQSFTGCCYLQNLLSFSWKNCITSTPCLVKCTASWSPAIVINSV